MLSHGHWDHAGGLPRAVSMIVQANGGRFVPLFLHPGMFRPRGTRQPDGGVLPMAPIPPPEEWALLGAEPIVTDAAQTCLDGRFFISGEIPRITSYEHGLVGQVCRPSDGADWVPDPLLMDERFLAVHVRGKGLVVFSACSHAGIVNVLHHARATFPDVKLHAVMGGFHLSGPTEAIIPDTVRDLGTFGLDLIIPAHCTGWRALNALERAYGEAVVLPSAVGKLFSL
jgi:7,8-dihydropterin-6-yl-methyl-4-(beta-D-ribofuranosyl)aminobenzene 5'-phosphate synthase